MQSVTQEPSTPPVDLPAEISRLQGCLAESEQQRAAQQQALADNQTLLEERARRIEQLLDLITLLKRKRFGRSADVISPDQLSLFDEAELDALIGELEAAVEQTEETPAPPPPAPKPKGKPVRRPLPEHLPRVERVIDLSEDEKQAMGSDWTFIGFDEAEQLAVIPRQPYVIRVMRAKYAPTDDSVADAEQGLVIAPRAPQILPKAIAHSSLLADVVVGKFVDALPLYRQETIWKREGIDLSRQTMAGWMIQLDAKLTPLMAAMKAALYQGRVIHIDETRLQVKKKMGSSLAIEKMGSRKDGVKSCNSTLAEKRWGQKDGVKRKDGVKSCNSTLACYAYCMARPLRIELSGGLYHVTSRGDRREDIFLDDQDRGIWLDGLGEVCSRFNWRCHAYCEMTNHYHVVVETPEANLSKGMRQLNGVYTQRFNRRHGLVGHLFQGRFKAILVERDSYLLELARYVVLNPVRAGMVPEVKAWAWSSYRAMVGVVSAPPWLETDWVLGQFGEERDRAQNRYADFVDAGVGKEHVWEELRNQIFHGSDAFVERFADTMQKPKALREVPRAQRRALAKPLVTFEHEYIDRREAMAQAFLSGAYTMQEIADHFHVHYATVSRAVRRHERSHEQKASSSD